MMKLTQKLLIVLIIFLGFSITAKAMDTNDQIYFKFNGEETNSIEVAGNTPTSVSMYVKTSNNIYGAVIPWTVGTGLSVSASTPTENNQSVNGFSIFYKINGSYTTTMVIDSDASRTGEVELAVFKVNAPSLEVGDTATITFSNGKTASNTANYDLTGATLTITKVEGPEYLPGDWDNDGYLKIGDVVNYARYVGGNTTQVNYFNETISPNDARKKTCLDLNDDDNYTIGDVVKAAKLFGAQ